MIIPEEYGQFNFRFGGSACPLGAEVTMGFSNPTHASAAACAASGLAEFVGEIMPVLTDDVTLVSVLCKLGPNEDGPSAEVASGAAGGISGNTTSPNVAILVHKLTAHGGRHGRGRMYLPGLGEGTVDNGGNIASGSVSDYNAALLGFLGGLDDDDVSAVLLHSDATTPYPIIGLTADGRAATQRRRLRR